MDTNSTHDNSQSMATDEQVIDIYEIMGIPTGEVPTEIHGVLKDVNEEGLDAILQMSGDLDFGCTLCGGTGYMANDEVCTNPKCQQQLQNQQKETLAKSRHGHPIHYFVPAKYREEDWDYSIASSNQSIIKTEPGAYQNYCMVLNKLLERAQQNLMLYDSVMVCSPAKTGKRRWAFTLLKTLNQNGIRTGGLEYLSDISMEDIMRHQVLVIFVTRYLFKENLDKLDHIVTKRRNRDLSTIILSEVSSRYFISDIDKKYIHFDIVADFTT